MASTPTHDRPCERGLKPRECHQQHIVPLLGTPHRRSYPCPHPDHPDRDPSFSINPGTKGQRMVWRCGAECDPVGIREALLGLGIDETCLGRYCASPKRDPAPGMPYRSVDKATIAAAKRFYAITHLPADLNGWLLRMCIQAISEGDGDLPGDPRRLLPDKSTEFYSLAERAGVGRYKYQLFEKWMAS